MGLIGKGDKGRDMDDLDRLEKGALEALARSHMGEEVKQVHREVHRRNKIRDRGAGRFKWENLDGVGLNQTIKIEIELPAYFVAGMSEFGRDGYREAVRNFLVSRGKTWWQPRFLSVLKAREIEAKSRFTRMMG